MTGGGAGPAALPGRDRVRGGEEGGSARPGARRSNNSEGVRTGAGIPSCPVASVTDGIDLHNPNKGPRKLADHRVDRDAASIDGLPAWPLDEPVVP